MAKKKRNQVDTLVSAVRALAGLPVRPNVVGKLMYPRPGGRYKRPGTITRMTACHGEGCTGDGVRVKWPNGQTTTCCLKTCTRLPTGDFIVQ